MLNRSTLHRHAVIGIVHAGIRQHKRTVCNEVKCSEVFNPHPCKQYFKNFTQKYQAESLLSLAQAAVVAVAGGNCAPGP